MTVSIALLGAGRIGRVHARAVTSVAGVRLAAIADANAEAAGEIAALYETLVSTIDDIAADDNIDAVIIATPTGTHADLIEKFARAGKAIFCEKPVDLDSARARQCLAVVEETGARLMLGFNRRFDPNFQALKQTIADGKIGNPEMLHIVSRDPAPPPISYLASSGGFFKDMTIHDFDMSRFLLGEEIETVQASGSALIDPEIGKIGDFDSASTILTTVSGRQCTISNSRRATFGYDQRIEVLGSKGAVSAENLRPASIELATAEGFLRPPIYDFFMTRYVDAFAAEIRSFAENLKSGAAMSPSGNDGLKALEIAEAADLSAREKRLVYVSEIRG
ncbi:inositol 2-dehydrogenase [Martelella radicis]|uniref:Myo-inositol 2-dehydrogenase/D-chiro-inositol 1-dehydrogenase n=1 Tax=Martelella radicis TaxID=1397476 RepID=A0A7W6KG46_9HYPH|nr:inositol 2-dehydrogenase [Martelella radicis]MBB4120586.1 myo-inositol 2-dehydrogenase/D-chiro-inositol 1-dehydrogenase [Martelella radicis]